ncbi:unnamed protein product, partial [Amoebophrya sp. A120]|eukprot:GSA120T00001111001.1
MSELIRLRSMERPVLPQVLKGAVVPVETGSSFSSSSTSSTTSPAKQQKTTPVATVSSTACERSGGAKNAGSNSSQVEVDHVQHQHLSQPDKPPPII